MLEAGKIIEQLKSEGYDKVYAWEAEPDEEDLDHSHNFETLIHVTKGSIFLKVGNDERTLHEGDSAVVGSEIVHYAKVGPEGCNYIVAEKHKQ